MSLAASSPALGQDGDEPERGLDCARHKPHVSVGFTGSWDQEVKVQALSDLSAALAPQGMSACPLEGIPHDKSIAQVMVLLDEGTTVRISVDDSLTNKRVARDVRLRNSSDSASGLIVAVAVDELLRATWAELSIKKKESPPVPEHEPAPSVEEPRETTTDAPHALPLHRLAVRGAIDTYVIGSTFFGADVVYGSHVADLVEWTAFAGPRFSRSDRVSELGSVRADAVSFGLEAQFPLVRTPKFLFGPEISFAATHAWFQGKTEAGAESRAQGTGFSGWALSPRGGLFARLMFGAGFLGVHSRVGVPLLGLEVTDERGPVGGMTGLEWTNAFSVGWGWAQ